HAPGTFAAILDSDRRDIAEAAVEGSFVGRYLIDLAQEGFAGTATQLLDRLEVLAGPYAARHKGWPVTPRGLSGLVRKLRPSLAEMGIAVDFHRPGHERHRMIHIYREDSPLDGGSVLAFMRPGTQRASPAEEVAGTLRALGIDRNTPPTRAAPM